MRLADWRERGRPFFVLSLSDRLQTWSPDVNIFGLGLALAALVFSYQAADDPSLWDSGLLLTFTIAAGWLMVKGVLQRKPTAEIDERWDARYDELRDQTDKVLEVLPLNFISSVWSRAQSHGERSRETWIDYVKHLPIPMPDERPLHEWDYFLQSHESQDIRQFFRFTSGAGERADVSNFRRYGVRTYHRFGRLLGAEADGFQDWLDDEGVKDGAEEIVVLLAYLEIAKAVQHPTEFRGDGHSGFWYLASRWHPYTVELPRPTPAAPAGPNS